MLKQSVGRVKRLGLMWNSVGTSASAKGGATPCPLLDAPGFLSSSMGRCFAGDCYEIRKSLIHFLP